jgi:hypothetical protein
VKAKAMMRVMAKAMRVGNNSEGNGYGNEGGRQVTAMRAMTAATTVVGKCEGDSNSNEGGRQ